MSVTNLIDCPRCQAKGFIDGFQHVANGRCFLCAGNKTISINARYPKKDKLTCIVHKEYVLVRTGSKNEDDFYKPEYKEVLEVYFGKNQVCYQINDKNRVQLRKLYTWFKQNNAEMILSNKTEETKKKYAIWFK